MKKLGCLADVMGKHALQSAAGQIETRPVAAAMPNPGAQAPIQRTLVEHERFGSTVFYVDSRNPGGMIFQIIPPVRNLPMLITESGEMVRQTVSEDPNVIKLRTAADTYRYFKDSGQYQKTSSGKFWDPVTGRSFSVFPGGYYAGSEGNLFRYDGTGYALHLKSLTGDLFENESQEIFRYNPDDHSFTPQDDADLSGSEVESLRESQSAEAQSPEERGLAAAEEIRHLAADSSTMEGLASNFPALRHRYGMQNIEFRGGGDGADPVKVWFKINPEFQVSLVGGHAVEMRSEGKGGGVTNAGSGVSPQTRVMWTPAALNFPSVPGTTLGAASFTVGGAMVASPLSQDHAAGSLAAADDDHTGMMGRLASKGVRSKTGSGSGPYYFIKGHLLNDNLGGIANEANLFPITHEANGQHKNFVEQYIKKGVDAGYVYHYQVQVSNISFKYDAGLGRQAVDSDLNFSFSRLDTAGAKIASTTHAGKIESRYELSGAESFDKPTEYATDYTGGSYNHPVAVGGEMTNKTAAQAPVTSNAGLTDDVSASGFTFGAPLFNPFAAASSAAAPAQSLAPSAALIPAGQSLSLRQSATASVIGYYSKLVSGWNTSDITGWLHALRSAKLTKWQEVKDLATKHHLLDAAMGDAIFDTGAAYRVRVTINGTALGI